MTDYELFSSFIEAWNLVWAIFSVYISVTFAFIIAAYLAASNLTRKLAALAVGLYSIVALWCLIGVERFATNAVNAGVEIRRLVEAGESTLDWTTVASEPEGQLALILVLIWAVFLLTYTGSVSFFFLRRRSRA